MYKFLYGLVGGFVLLIGFIILGSLLLPASPSLTVSRPPLALPREAPAHASGQAIALTCARMANVDMDGLITRAQVLEMERCAERMIALMR
jgi:hypothetical protein